LEKKESSAAGPGKYYANGRFFRFTARGSFGKKEGVKDTKSPEA